MGRDAAVFGLANDDDAREGPVPCNGEEILYIMTR